MILTSHPRLSLALLLATILAAVVASSEGLAYTAEQQQACTPDAFRLCSSEIPDLDRVTACMVRNRAQLSPQCRAFIRPSPEPADVESEAPGKPVSINPAAAHKSRLHRVKKPNPDDT